MVGLHGFTHEKHVFFLVFPHHVGYLFSNYFFTRFGTDVEFIVASFWHSIQCFLAIDLLMTFWMVFLLIFNQNGSQNQVARPLFFLTFSILFPRGYFGRSLGSFWHPFGSIWIAFGTLWASRRSLLMHFPCSIWIALGTLQAPRRSLLTHFPFAHSPCPLP